jgi:hypothetical protein
MTGEPEGFAVLDPVLNVFNGLRRLFGPSAEATAKESAPPSETSSGRTGAAAPVLHGIAAP